ncbi:MAG: hypothetical protein A3H64_02640 [Candidatus Ryanbacteria bacterium RIFCSPLOWO2_02_FULL_45_11c]|uniref:Uncharacterized protein n=1 Tax=Candidatus Ryanbacteria bacterium RIFCSPLOWO2_02_FULL_45_11c TaxID=1802128 RepID=A0A1G2GX67_9BACT|nr:MAG: hypothetical protein A3H64_02640 [Candidatus Ryanbacteria bacterium RIFCSPLOWO2_02_FULL_45_11c]
MESSSKLQHYRRRGFLWGSAAGFSYAVIGIVANRVCIKTAILNPPELDSLGYLVPKDHIFCHVPFVSWMVTVEFFTGPLFLIILITVASGIIGAVIGQIFWRTVRRKQEASEHL